MYIEPSDISISYALCVHNEGKQLEYLLKYLMKRIDDNDEIVLLDDFSDDPDTREILDVFPSVYDNIRMEQRHLFKDFASQKNHLKQMCENDYVFNLDPDEKPTEHLLKMLKEIIFLNQDVEVFYTPRVNIVYGITEQHVQKWGWKIEENRSIKRRCDIFDIDGPEFALIKNMGLISEQVMGDKFKEVTDESTHFIIMLRKAGYTPKQISELRKLKDPTKIVVRYFPPMVNFPDYQSRIWKNTPNIAWVKPVHETLRGFTRYSTLPDEYKYSLLHYKNIDKQESQNAFYDTI